MNKPDSKSFNLRLPLECWKFLKHKSTETQKSLNAIILDYIQKDKQKDRKKTEKELTL